MNWQPPTTPVWIAAFLLASAAAAQRHEDAVPRYPPGFSPIELSETERAGSAAQRTQELRRQVDTDMYYRYQAPERAIRARYGSATFRMYDPYY